MLSIQASQYSYANSHSCTRIFFPISKAYVHNSPAGRERMCINLQSAIFYNILQSGDCPQLPLLITSEGGRVNNLEFICLVDMSLAKQRVTG